MKNLTGIWPSTITTFSELFHYGTSFHTNKKDMYNCKSLRDTCSSVCSFHDESRERCGIIVNFCLATEPIVIIKEFDVSGLFTKEIGTPCRAKLQEYAHIDLLAPTQHIYMMANL